MSQDLLNYFQILKKRELLGTSYLFIGEDTSLIPDIVKLINCPQDSYFCDSCWDCKRIESGNHPDLFTVEPDGFNVKIETIREGMRFLSLKSFRSKNKVMIIKEAQNLTPAAANAFLKTLEEPPKHSFMAITTSKLEGVLPTIISRCRKIFLPPKFSQVDSVSEESALRFLGGEDIRFSDRKKFPDFLWALVMVLRRGLLAKVDSRNNQLLGNRESEIILSSYSLDKIDSILKDILNIYGAYKSINMNLALNLIRLRLS
ncbi:MAG: hypothetical protein ABIE75_03695 [Candidatus Omnitrophota bacterium]